MSSIEPMETHHATNESGGALSFARARTPPGAPIAFGHPDSATSLRYSVRAAELFRRWLWRPVESPAGEGD